MFLEFNLESLGKMFCEVVEIYLKMFEPFVPYLMARRMQKWNSFYMQYVSWCNMLVVTDLFNLLDMTVVSAATFITMAKTELLYPKNLGGGHR